MLGNRKREARNADSQCYALARGSKGVLGGPGKAFYFEGIRKLDHRWVNCIVLKGDYFEK